MSREGLNSATCIANQTTEMNILLLLQDWGEWFVPDCKDMKKAMSDYWTRITTLKHWAMEMHADEPTLSVKSCCVAAVLLFFSVFHGDEIFNKIRRYPESELEEFFGEIDSLDGIQLFHEYEDLKKAEMEATYVPTSSSAMYAFFFPSTSTYTPLRMHK